MISQMLAPVISERNSSSFGGFDDKKEIVEQRQLNAKAPVVNNLRTDIIGGLFRKM
jgi:hypothetical protein